MPDFNVGEAATLLQDGGMVRLTLADTTIVLARAKGLYYAIGANCTHYGAPLDKGLLRGHELMCPLHHACFDIRTGARLEPPALNNIAHFPVRVEDKHVIVTLPKDNEAEPQGRRAPGDDRAFVIVGGGAAGNAAAEELRRVGCHASITILSAAPDIPVDRPNLSKDYLAGHADPSWMPLRGGRDWYAARDIDLRTGTEVVKVDPSAHTVHLRDGHTVKYSKLLLATGGIPRQLTSIPGADLKGVFTLRAQADADAIVQAVETGKRVVLIGASFIAMEVAAALVEGRKATVTVVGIEAVPFERVLGERIGRMLQQEHQNHGVQFRLSSEPVRFTDNKGQVSGVELKSGEKLPADVVIVGVGVRPATDFLAESGVKLDARDRSVLVNAYLQTSDPDIYAAGDIARWDDGSEAGQRTEHWRVAEQQGIVAARNMTGQPEAIRSHVPFFWTHQWDIELRYVGHAEKWDEILYRGSVEEKDFIAFYVVAGNLRAAATCGHDSEADALEFILRDKVPLTPTQMRDGSFDLLDYARHH